MCKLTCQSGAGAAGDANASSLPVAGIFNPPYAIGNGASNLPLGTKVNMEPQPTLPDILRYMIMISFENSQELELVQQ